MGGDSFVGEFDGVAHLSEEGHPIVREEFVALYNHPDSLSLSAHESTAGRENRRKETHKHRSQTAWP